MLCLHWALTGRCVSRARGSRGQRGDLLAPSVCLVGPRTSRVWAAPWGRGCVAAVCGSDRGVCGGDSCAARGGAQEAGAPQIPKMQGGWRSLFPDPSCLGRQPTGT